MSRFQVDVVATPRLDLFNATAKDLAYREANGKYPMASRSQMAKEQEKLNKFLQYVNESFIIKGFSKNSGGQQESGTRSFTARNTSEELWFEGDEITLGNFSISHGDNAQLLVMYTITGDGMRVSNAQAVLMVRIMENNSQVALLRQAVDGYFTMSVPFLLANRKAGVTKIQVLAQIVDGEVYVSENGYFAQALVME